MPCGTESLLGLFKIRLRFLFTQGGTALPIPNKAPAVPSAGGAQGRWPGRPDPRLGTSAHPCRALLCSLCASCKLSQLFSTTCLCQSEFHI